MTYQATNQPCPFCGKADTLKLTTAEALANEGEDDPMPWDHSPSWAVICDGSKPLGPGGCGASGGFMPTEAEAIELWNRRALPPQAKAEPAGVSDEQIYALAKEHFGDRGHALIWQDDPKYAAACDMDEDARWSVSAIRAEQTIAFARAILSAAPSTGMRDITAALSSPGVERLRDFYSVGPVQRAAVESFVDALGVAACQICKGAGCFTCGEEHRAGVKAARPPAVLTTDIDGLQRQIIDGVKEGPK